MTASGKAERGGAGGAPDPAGGRAAAGAAFAVVTLGCPKNEADSDRLRARLSAAGHRPAPLESADLVVVNTCGFIDAAKEESIAAILDAAEAAHSRGAQVAGYGCLVERYRRELEEELREADLLCGFETEPLVAALAQLARDRDRSTTGELAGTRRPPRPVHAYLKISDGCDHHCTFCAIPLIKGRYAITPPEQVLAEARAALARGARELVLVGQDTTRYEALGYGGLERLLEDVAALEPARLRLLYLQPEAVTEGLLDTLAAHAVPYLDIPLQHASGRVLRAMGRQGDGASHLELLGRIRNRMPSAAVRSTFITGFPGEKAADFAELVTFAKEAKLAVAGVFPFDPQDGTRAATMPGQVPARVRERRAAQLTAALEEAARPFWEAFAGQHVEVLVERGARSTVGESVGRVWAQAPDVDGLTFVRGAPARRGQVIPAVVEVAAGYDLLARPA